MCLIANLAQMLFGLKCTATAANKYSILHWPVPPNDQFVLNHVLVFIRAHIRPLTSAHQWVKMMNLQSHLQCALHALSLSVVSATVDMRQSPPFPAFKLVFHVVVFAKRLFLAIFILVLKCVILARVKIALKNALKSLG